MPQMRAVMSGSLRKVASAQKRFEEARRLEDAELHVGDPLAPELDVQRAFAFDSGQRVDSNGVRCAAHARSHSSLALRNCHAHALNPRNARDDLLVALPQNAQTGLVSEAVFGVSMGP